MFSKGNFSPEILVKVAIPKAYGGGEIVLPLSIARNDDYERIRLSFVAKPETERTGEVVMETIRSFICALLRRQPEGIKDFPIQTLRPEVENKTALYFRALDYFTNNEPDLQEFFDGIFMTAWLIHKELAEPETFPGTVPDSGARRPGGVAAQKKAASRLPRLRKNLRAAKKKAKGNL
ncbi:MAG TPA: hypothetical protein VF556_08575 [Pyrinomonadaceae bacterium]|jgi:hypothetical protein